MTMLEVIELEKLDFFSLDIGIWDPQKNMDPEKSRFLLIVRELASILGNSFVNFIAPYFDTKPVLYDQ